MSQLYHYDQARTHGWRRVQPPTQEFLQKCVFWNSNSIVFYINSFTAVFHNNAHPIIDIFVCMCVCTCLNTDLTYPKIVWATHHHENKYPDILLRRVVRVNNIKINIYPGDNLCLYLEGTEMNGVNKASEPMWVKNLMTFTDQNVVFSKMMRTYSNTIWWIRLPDKGKMSSFNYSTINFRTISQTSNNSSKRQMQDKQTNQVEQFCVEFI